MLSFFSLKKRNRPNDKRARLVSFRSKHSVARQSVISDVASIVSVVRVLYPIAEVLCRPTECFILQEQVLCRPSGCFIQSRKQSVARQSTLFCRSKHYVARHNTLSDRSKHSVGRQSTPSNCGNTLTADRVQFPVEASITTAVRVLYPIAEASCRPTEC